MSRFFPRLLPVGFAVFFVLAGMSFGSTPRPIIPSRGQKIEFARTYTRSYLKNHPLQRVTKTRVTLKNTKGLFTATWDATFRDIRTDELIDLSATGICKAKNPKHAECNFDLQTGTVEIYAQPDGIFVLIPVGQGVLLSREKDGIVRSEFLLGADDNDSSYRLLRK